LIKNYPELASYLTRGEAGELKIDDSGWDEMLEAQEKAIVNT
jgi:hypothetical protein